MSAQPLTQILKAELAMRADRAARIAERIRDIVAANTTAVSSEILAEALPESLEMETAARQRLLYRIDLMLDLPLLPPMPRP